MAEGTQALIEFLVPKQLPEAHRREVARALEILVKNGPTRFELALKLVLLIANCLPWLAEPNEHEAAVGMKATRLATEAFNSWVVGGKHRRLRNGQSVRTA